MAKVKSLQIASGLFLGGDIADKIRSKIYIYKYGRCGASCDSRSLILNIQAKFKLSAMN